MADYIITIEGCEELDAALLGASEVRFEVAVKMAARNIYNRAMQGGTPVSTERTRPGGPHGELRQSTTIDVQCDKAEVGYTKDYAPHVEFGHRTRGGGYVAGQHYLQRNVDQEKDSFKKLLTEQLRKVLK